jgi:hypothetical protein
VVNNSGATQKIAKDLLNYLRWFWSNNRKI